MQISCVSNCNRTTYSLTFTQAKEVTGRMVTDVVRYGRNYRCFGLLHNN